MPTLAEQKSPGVPVPVLIQGGVVKMNADSGGQRLKLLKSAETRKLLNWLRHCGMLLGTAMCVLSWKSSVKLGHQPGEAATWPFEGDPTVCQKRLDLLGAGQVQELLQPAAQGLRSASGGSLAVNPDNRD